MRASKETRREMILLAALDLASRHGFRKAGMNEIGAAAGLTGPALYRYFASKAELLVTLHGRVIDMQLAVADEAVALIAHDPTAALTRLVRSHARSVLDNLELYHLYLHERSELPAEDARRLGLSLLPYFEVWRSAIHGHLPSISADEASVLQGAVIGVLHSPVYFAPVLPKAEMAVMLEQAAWRVIAASELSGVGVTADDPDEVADLDL